MAIDWTTNPGIQFFDGSVYQKITDHNRTPIEISFDRIERKSRMVDGTMRKYVVAVKRTFTTSWENVPSKRNIAGALTTVDNGWSGSEIESFHNTNTGAFNVKFLDGAGNSEIVACMISDFSKTVAKRGVTDLWNMSITLEEV